MLETIEWALPVRDTRMCISGWLNSVTYDCWCCHQLYVCSVVLYILARVMLCYK